MGLLWPASRIGSGRIGSAASWGPPPARPLKLGFARRPGLRRGPGERNGVRAEAKGWGAARVGLTGFQWPPADANEQHDNSHQAAARTGSGQGTGADWTTTPSSQVTGSGTPAGPELQLGQPGRPRPKRRALGPPARPPNYRGVLPIGVIVTGPPENAGQRGETRRRERMTRDDLPQETWACSRVPTCAESLG